MSKNSTLMYKGNKIPPLFDVYKNKKLVCQRFNSKDGCLNGDKCLYENIKIETNNNKCENKKKKFD